MGIYEYNLLINGRQHPRQRLLLRPAKPGLKSNHFNPRCQGYFLPGIPFFARPTPL